MKSTWCRFELNGKASYGRIAGQNVIAVDGEPWGEPRDTGATHALSAVKLLVPEGDEEDIESSDNLFQAIKTILIADLVMSLDNVIGVAAAGSGW